MVFWVFGYGSLVWNPGFEYDEKVIGCIKDYRRVFDLGTHILLYYSILNVISHAIVSDGFVFNVSACIDHRGTPEHPARTCTLEHKEGAVCVSNLSLSLFVISKVSAFCYMESYYLFLTLRLLFQQWGAAYSVRGGPEKERLAMEVSIFNSKLNYR